MTIKSVRVQCWDADSDQETLVALHTHVHAHTHTQFQPTQSLIKCKTNPDLQGQAISGEEAHTAGITDASPRSQDSAWRACKALDGAFQMLLPFSSALSQASPFHRAKPHTQRPLPLRIWGLFLTVVQAAPPGRLQSQCFPLGAPWGRL